MALNVKVSLFRPLYVFDSRVPLMKRERGGRIFFFVVVIIIVSLL